MSNKGFADAFIDFWPDDRAVKIYVDQLTSLDWDVPIIASAAKRGFPELLGPGGMKMGKFSTFVHSVLDFLPVLCKDIN